MKLKKTHLNRTRIHIHERIKFKKPKPIQLRKGERRYCFVVIALIRFCNSFNYRNKEVPYHPCFNVLPRRHDKSMWFLLLKKLVHLGIKKVGNKETRGKEDFLAFWDELL